MDTAIGSVNINIFTQVDVTAVTSTFETGTLGMSGDANFSLTGAQANADVGTVTTVTGTGVNIATTGVSIQFAEGTETISGSAIVTPTGIEMSVVLGNMRSTPWANVVTGASNTWIEVAA
jgi:allophanate hydrolase subunit 2